MIVVGSEEVKWYSNLFRCGCCYLSYQCLILQAPASKRNTKKAQHMIVSHAHALCLSFVAA